MENDSLMEKFRRHQNSDKIGMIASHLGIIRGYSRDGRKVTAVEVSYDMDAVNRIKQQIRKLPGIVDVMINVKSGRFNVGDEILNLAVGGDIRENVFPALIKGVDMIKKEASSKKEFFD
jgi:molybdopterin synthase catalytic subunit